MRLFGNLLKRPRRPFCQPLPARRACCQRQRRCHAASARCRSRRRNGRRSRCWSQRVRPGRAAPARALQSTPAAGHAGSACRPRSTPASAGAAGERRPNTPLLCTRPLAFVIGSTREPKFWERSIVTRHLALAAALSWRASMLPLGAGAGRMREEKFTSTFSHSSCAGPTWFTSASSLWNCSRERLPRWSRFKMRGTSRLAKYRMHSEGAPSRPGAARGAGQGAC